MKIWKKNQSLSKDRDITTKFIVTDRDRVIISQFQFIFYYDQSISFRAFGNECLKTMFRYQFPRHEKFQNIVFLTVRVLKDCLEVEHIMLMKYLNRATTTTTITITTTTTNTNTNTENYEIYYLLSALLLLGTHAHHYYTLPNITTTTAIHCTIKCTCAGASTKVTTNRKKITSNSKKSRSPADVVYWDCDISA